jgi:hypothetical protein
MPLFGFPPAAAPAGLSADLISPAAALVPPAGVPPAGAGGSTVRAISIGWDALAGPSAATGGGVASADAAGAAGWAFANSLPHPRQNL